jgi:Mn-dependent DtxR family transcriptional regulator
MKQNTIFRTARGYQLLLQEKKTLTPSMEDYMEMIYRNCLREGFTRVNILAESLNVQAPSVSRMIQKLTELELLDFEKYGVIRLTESGRELGEFLYNRHQIIEEFLTLLGVTESLLTETEMIEHNVSLATLNRIAQLNRFFQAHPEIHTQFQNFGDGSSCPSV